MPGSFKCPKTLSPCDHLISDTMSLFCETAHSSTYAIFRPAYPDSLFENLASICPSRGLAWDVACGTGQATSSLSKLFEQVIGSDLSSSQLDHALRRDNIHYYLCSSECEPAVIVETMKIEPHLVDLITVAQALHWFDLDAFYSTAKHFLKPEGILAVWGYTWPRVQDSSELTRLILEMAEGVLGPYFAPQHKLVDNQYKDIPFPFASVIASTEEPYMSMDVEWSLECLFGMFRSWSGYNSAIKIVNVDPIDQLREQFTEAWGDFNERTITFPIFLLAGRPQ